MTSFMEFKQLFKETVGRCRMWDFVKYHWYLIFHSHNALMPQNHKLFFPAVESIPLIKRKMFIIRKKNILQLKLFIVGISEKLLNLRLSNFHSIFHTLPDPAPAAADAAEIPQHCHRAISLFVITLEANWFYINNISLHLHGEPCNVLHIYTQICWICFFLNHCLLWKKMLSL